MKWRIEGGDWHEEHAASQMVLNVAGALLTRDPMNADRLTGDAVSSNLQPTTRRAPRGAGRRGTGAASRSKSSSRKPDTTTAFWRFLKEETGGLPGQTDGWRSWNCWTTELNGAGDMVGMTLAGEWMGLYLRASEYRDTPSRAARMLRHSRTIRELMDDQELDGNEASRSRNGRSMTVRREWDRDDRDGWPEAARWIKDQADRLGP